MMPLISTTTHWNVCSLDCFATHWKEKCSFCTNFFSSSEAEARPTDTCFLPICSLKYAMRTVAKWFNAVARIAHRCKVIQLQCNTLHRLCLLQTCNQLICSFHHLLRASMPQHATYIALCKAYCCKSSLVLNALPFGDLYLLFLKTFRSLCKTTTGQAKKKYDCPTFAALFMRVI